MVSRQSKNTPPHEDVDFSKIKIGLKNLEDAILTIGDYQKNSGSLASKAKIFQAIKNAD